MSASLNLPGTLGVLMALLGFVLVMAGWVLLIIDGFEDSVAKGFMVLGLPVLGLFCGFCGFVMYMPMGFFYVIYYLVVDYRSSYKEWVVLGFFGGWGLIGGGIALANWANLI